MKGFLRNSSSPSLRRTFRVEYRLSRQGKSGEGSVSPFPTAVKVDALAGYTSPPHQARFSRKKHRRRGFRRWELGTHSDKIPP